MRQGVAGAVLVVLALVGAGAAMAGPTCTEAGCVSATDKDGDGVPDEAWASLGSGTGYYGVSVIAGKEGLTAYWDTEGDETVDPHLVTAGNAWVVVESHDGAVHAHEGGVAWFAYWHEHDTNERDDVAVVIVAVHDHDGDGVPEDVHVERVEALP